MSNRRNPRRPESRRRTEGGPGLHRLAPYPAPRPLPPPIPGPLDFTVGTSPRALAHLRALLTAYRTGRSLGLALALVGPYIAHELGQPVDLDVRWADAASEVFQP